MQELFTVESLKIISPFITVFASGLFGLLVACATWWLSSKREKAKFLQDVMLQDFKSLEDLYVSCIAQYEKSIQYTKSALDYSALFNDMAFLSGRVALLASPEVIRKRELINELLFYWSTEYKKGAPKKVGDTNYAIVSNLDYQHKEKAEEIFEQLIKEIMELVPLMKMHLSELKREIKN